MSSDESVPVIVRQLKSFILEGTSLVLPWEASPGMTGANLVPLTPPPVS